MMADVVGREQKSTLASSWYVMYARDRKFLKADIPHDDL